MGLTLHGLAMIFALGAAEEKMELIQGTSGSRTGQLEVHAGGLVVREGSAGSVFGTVRAGKGKRQLSYFVVVKHRLGGDGKQATNEEATAENSEGESKQTLTIDGKSLQIDYKVKLDGDRKVSRETIVVNGKTVDVAKGRVFLVDLTKSPPTWKQHKLNLPAEVASATTRKAAEELTRKVLASLTKQNPEVKSFVESAGK
jgi:hypothetical protein